jgi:uncharacterized protein (TIGR02996 family)
MAEWLPPSDTLTGLLLAAQAEPEGDDTTRLVLADYLDERGDPRGAMVRLSTALAHHRPGDPEWHDLGERLEAWQQRHQADWLGKQGTVTLHRGLVRLELGDAALSGRTLASRLRSALEQGWVVALRTHFSGRSLERTISLGRLARVAELEAGEFTRADRDRLGGLTHLRGLALRCGYKTRGSAGLGFLANLRRLQRFKLAFRGEPVEPLLPLASLGGLRELALTGCGELTSEHLSVLAQLPNLASLELTECPLTPAILVQVGSLHGLRRLTLGRCSELRPHNLNHLCELSQLSQVILFDCERLTDEWLEALARLPQLSSLRLHSAASTERGLEPLAALSNLRALTLDACQSLWGAGFAQFTGLERLVLPHSPITDEELAGICRLSRLHFLDLTWSRGFNPAGLAGLSRLPELRCLCLSRDHLTDATLNHLRDLKQLRELRLPSRGHFPRATVEELPRLLPHCRVRFGDESSPLYS